MRQIVRLLAALVLCAGTAQADPTPPVLAGEGGRASGWVALKVASEGTPLTISVTGGTLKGPGVIVFVVYSASDQPLFFVFSPRGAVEWGAYVDVNEVPGQPVVIDDQQAGSRADASLATTFTPAQGTVKVLAFWAGETTWAWSLHGAGNTVEAITSGDRSWIFDSKDFSADANAWIKPRPPSGGGAGAQVLLEGSRQLQIDHALISIFRMGDESAGRMSYTSPGGAATDCSGPVGAGFPAGTSGCSTFAVAGPDARGPGTYTFEASSAGAYASTMGVWLYAADAFLPS